MRIVCWKCCALDTKSTSMHGNPSKTQAGPAKSLPRRRQLKLRMVRSLPRLQQEKRDSLRTLETSMKLLHLGLSPARRGWKEFRSRVSHPGQLHCRDGFSRTPKKPASMYSTQSNYKRGPRSCQCPLPRKLALRSTVRSTRSGIIALANKPIYLHSQSIIVPGGTCKETEKKNPRKDRRLHSDRWRSPRRPREAPMLSDSPFHAVPG
jgi:hypothetical protein